MPTCSGADPSSDTVHKLSRQFRDLQCHPRFPGDNCCADLLFWPTPGPAKCSEPAIIRLPSLNTSGIQGFFDLIFADFRINRINDLHSNSGRPGNCLSEWLPSVRFISYKQFPNRPLMQHRPGTYGPLHTTINQQFTQTV